MTLHPARLLLAAFSIPSFFGGGGTLIAAPGPALAPARLQSLPTICVEATYPGANSQVVAETLAVPIEQQVLGAEGLRHMFSRSADDGAYVLHALFQRGTDLNMAQVLVQNRVSLALPILPDSVQRRGMTVKKRSRCPLLLAILFSPDASRDVLYLGNYATIQVRDELVRLPGVAEVVVCGAADYGLRVWLDPERMAALELTGTDVISAIQQQRAEVAERPGDTTETRPDAPLRVISLGRLTGAEDFANVIIKAAGDGGVVRLKDVARIELGGGGRGADARLDGKPAAVLAVFPMIQSDTREVSAALGKKLSELRSLFPVGVDLCTGFDFTANPLALDRSTPREHLLVEVALPADVSPERTQAILDRCRALLQNTEGVQNVLELTELPFGALGCPPCLVVRLAVRAKPDGREGRMRAIRARLEGIEGAAFRLCDLSHPDGYPPAGFPIDLAVSGPEAGPVREIGQRLIERLRTSGTLTDVGWDARYTATLHRNVEVDRAKAAALGVPVGDVFDSLRLFLGFHEAGHFNSFGRTWQVRVASDANSRGRAEDIGKLKVRSRQGKMLPLASLATIREASGAAVLDRLDGQPMVEITANPAPGVSLAQARWVCETTADEEIRSAAEYRLTWIAELPPPEPIAGAETRSKSAAVRPPPEVAVAAPVVREIEDYEDCTGRTHAISTVDVRARVTGYLEKVHFKEGSDVRKGELLFEIDARPYQAELAKAEAAAQRAEVRCQRAQAAVRKAEGLVAAKTMTTEEFDHLRNEFEDAQAALRAAQAGLDLAKLNLDYSKVAAFIDGRIGRCLVTPGNLVKADETLLATIVSRDQIAVYFELDERTALGLMRVSRPKGARLALLGLADEEGYPRKGTVDFVDNRVDPDTGTLKIRAVFPNAGGLLVPGLFARIRLTTGTPRKALLVPERAIRAEGTEKFLFVVDDQNKVVRRSVTLGASRDGLRVIEQGLQAGDRVVTDVRRKVLPGMPVTPQVQERN